MRKSMMVKDILAEANEMLLQSQDDHIEYRQGVIHMIEHILHATGNYHGFRYLSSNDMKKSTNGTTVGINTTIHHPAETMEYDEMFMNTDCTRVCYF